MEVSGNALRPGHIIQFEDSLWMVVKTQHTQPGKGGAYMQVELKNVMDGTKKHHRFRSSESVKSIYREEVPYQYLYQDQDQYVFMNPETYEQITLSEGLLSGSPKFLQEGMQVMIGFYNQSPISVTLPPQVVLTVEEADPVVKGQTASASYKPAVLSNGIKTSVPPHITPGTKVVINTEDAGYVERYKED